MKNIIIIKCNEEKEIFSRKLSIFETEKSKTKGTNGDKKNNR